MPRDRFRCVLVWSTFDFNSGKLDSREDSSSSFHCLFKFWLNYFYRCKYYADSGSVYPDIRNFSANVSLTSLTLWAKLRPARLPRRCNSIVVGTLYHPPSASDTAIMEYLIKCLSSIESCYPNCGFLIAGDLNRLQITRLRNNFQLKQIVHFPTRGRRTLD